MARALVVVTESSVPSVQAAQVWDALDDLRVWRGLRRGAGQLSTGLATGGDGAGAGGRPQGLLRSCAEPEALRRGLRGCAPPAEQRWHGKGSVSCSLGQFFRSTSTCTVACLLPVSC
eukprot:11178649-Lingulodinium_polyedra.AAC.2